MLVVQAEDGKVDADAIQAHCRVHLPMFMLPGHVEITTELPRNPNGKIDRKALSTQFAHVFSRPETDA